MMKQLPSIQEMERAMNTRDASYDGVFYLAVRTTGIFCRPSCPARKPRVENVEFFARTEDAVFAGYRPCKRCRPLHVSGTAPEWIEALLERVDANPGERIPDAEIRAMGIEPARVRRYFQDRFGMTFQAYCRGRRLGGALASLRSGGRIDDAVFEHGYESHSGFRDAFTRLFGAPPGRAADSRCVRVSLEETPLGPMIYGATDDSVCLVEFASRRMLEAQIESVRRRFSATVVPGNNPVLELLRVQMTEYFAGTRTRFEIPLAAPGTVFQERVWRELRAIPYGETWSYETLAARAGAPGAVRAAGTANGANRIAIVIPCHRVVRKNGETGGYGGGRWRKVALLDLEASVMKRDVPTLGLFRGPRDHPGVHRRT
ncbi:MAG TPA: methylated-DNA--[protein]-cysteine S-methyltransferase [Candidatus Krumholzibacteria bacterium]|nr:methylated-DNA--[protein]-cysteine S-methyltransferase [Candidatus Krumholzibacteria bacterium]